MINELSKQTVEQKAKLFRGFADPSRLSILEALREGEKTVSELVAATGLSQSNVSNHLACLRDCGLVSTRPEGRFAVYSLSDAAVDDLLEQAANLLTLVAKGVAGCVRYNLEEAVSQPSSGEA